MKIFSTHRKKLEPHRRFGGMKFRAKIKEAANYKRAFNPGNRSWRDKFWQHLGLTSKLLRWAIYAVLIVIVYFFVISSRLVIADFQISGNSQISSQQIQDVLNQEGGHRLFFVKKANYFLMTRGRVNKMLTSQSPIIKEVVSYRRIWPNKAELTVRERTPGFALKSNNNYFLLDDEGTVVKQLEDPSKLLVVEDSAAETFALGETLPNGKLAPFVISMSKAWGTKLTGSVKTVIFPGKASEEVQFISSEGWGVFFNINRPVSSQLTDLAVILAKKVPAADRGRLAYIDLRISKLAYLCFKGTPCQQQDVPQENPDAAKQ